MKVGRQTLGLSACMFLLMPLPSLANEIVDYTYDELGRLVKVSSVRTGLQAQVADTAFDPAGNRTTYSVSIDGSTPPATFAVSNATASEGTVATFSVTRAGNLTGTVAVNYATVSGTAVAASDFVAASGSLSFAVNETAKSVIVSTIDDSVTESPEQFSLVLSSPSVGSVISDDTGVASILDNDSASGFISITDNDLNVLPAHQSTYSCTNEYVYVENIGSILLEFCLATVNAQIYLVYSPGSSPPLDPGYTMTVAKRLDVTSSYYGTGVAP